MKQLRLWVIRRTDTPTWTYQSKKPNGNCGWLAVADLMREEMYQTSPIKSVVYDSIEDAEAAMVGLKLQYPHYDLSAKAAFGVLSRWVLGSTAKGSTSRSRQTRLPRQTRSG